MRRIGMKRFCFALVAALAIAAPAAAQQVCLQLESQLAAIDRGGGMQEYQQLLARYQRDSAAYDQAYRQAEQMGCIVLFRRFAPPACAPVIADLDRMQANIAGLEQSLRSADPANLSGARSNILRALAANNCGTQYAPYAAAPQQGGILDRLFGAPIVDPYANAPTVTTYRTVCVRGCDGYFFPLSFSTTQSQFAADARTCEAQCPGAELYIYRNPGEAIDAAVNLRGQSYAALPNAFAFRQDYNPSCSCQNANTFAGLAGQTFTPIEPGVLDRIAQLRAVIPVPLGRPVPSEDPETLANRVGGLVPGADLIGPIGAVAGVTGDGGVRLIGPAYYYAR